MNKEWVEAKEAERKEKVKAEFERVREKLKNSGMLNDEEMDWAMEHIRKRVKLGFSDSLMMFPFHLFEKRQMASDDGSWDWREKIENVFKGIDFYELVKAYHENYERFLDSEPVAFDGDIIITDPCYITYTKDDDWGRCGYGDDMGILGLAKYMVRDTIYGDWSCTTFNVDTKEEMGQFCADAGLVGVFLLDEVLKYNPGFDYHENREWTTTWIKDFKGEVWFEVREDTWIDEDEEKEYTEYGVHVVGKGINKKTGEAINFVTSQTGL